MESGRTAALIAVMTGALVQSAGAAEVDDKAHLHFDYNANCAIFDVEPTAALDATWSGGCVQGLASGRGVAVFTRADHTRETVTAAFRNGRVEDGRASIQWSDGAHFEGNIVAGLPNGTGVLIRINGDRFDGIWKHGILHGHGLVTWANGDRYDGEFVDGRAEGHGVQIWANGDRYDGPWHNDLPNGTGTLTRKTGNVFAARFIDGRPQTQTPTRPKAKLVHPVLKQAAAPSPPPYRLGEGPANLENVPVRESIVHPIDEPVSMPIPANRRDAATANEAVASNCLSVDSDGSYWGFRNHCDYSVQFSYCLLRDTGMAVICDEHGAGAAPGSVAASGFSALFADTSLSGGPAEHDFRWVACRGGAGEVEARLDVVEPASGRCLRRSAMHQQQASN